MNEFFRGTGARYTRLSVGARRKRRDKQNFETQETGKKSPLIRGQSSQHTRMSQGLNEEHTEEKEGLDTYLYQS